MGKVEQTHVTTKVILLPVSQAACKKKKCFFYSHCALQHVVWHLLCVFFFMPAVFLTHQTQFLFFLLFFFYVYEGYVNLTSFKLHFQVLELQIKASAGGSVNLWRSPQLNWVSAVAQVSNPCSRICTSGVVQAHGCFLPSLKAVKALLDEMSKTSHNNLEHAVSSSHL